MALLNRLVLTVSSCAAAPGRLCRGVAELPSRSEAAIPLFVKGCTMSSSALRAGCLVKLIYDEFICDDAAH